MDAAAAFSSAEAPTQQQGRVLGQLHSAVAAGSLFGPLLGGLLVGAWGFRPVLLLMGLMTLASAIAAWFYLQEQHHLTLPTETKTTAVSHSFRELLHMPRTRAFIGAGIAAKLGVFGLVAVFAPFVQRSMAVTAEAAATWVGLLQAVTWSASWVGASWWGRQNDRRPVEQNYRWASLGCGISIVLQPWLPQLPWLLLLRTVQGFCFSALEQSVFLVVARHSNLHNRGVRIGATNSLLITGQILGALSSTVLGGFLGIPGLFLVMGAAFGVGAVWISLCPPPLCPPAKE